MEERRNLVRQRAGALIAAVAIAGGARACELPAGTRLDSERLAVSYRTEPAKIAVGQHFTLDLAICPKHGAAFAGRVKLDAHMPEHRHGMNYRPNVVKALSAGQPGRYSSEGWMFHMPGRWEFVFELGSERLAHSVRVE